MKMFFVSLQLDLNPKSLLQFIGSGCIMICCRKFCVICKAVAGIAGERVMKVKL